MNAMKRGEQDERDVDSLAWPGTPGANLYGNTSEMVDAAHSEPLPRDPAGVQFLDRELNAEARSFTVSQLRMLANVYAAWASQCRFKADLLEGRMSHFRN